MLWCEFAGKRKTDLHKRTELGLKLVNEPVLCPSEVIFAFTRDDCKMAFWHSQLHCILTQNSRIKATEQNKFALRYLGLTHCSVTFTVSLLEGPDYSRICKLIIRFFFYGGFGTRLFLCRPWSIGENPECRLGSAVCTQNSAAFCHLFERRDLLTGFLKTVDEGYLLHLFLLTSTPFSTSGICVVISVSDDETRKNGASRFVTGCRKTVNLSRAEVKLVHRPEEGLLNASVT